MKDKYQFVSMKSFRKYEIVWASFSKNLFIENIMYNFSNKDLNSQNYSQLFYASNMFAIDIEDVVSRNDKE